MRGGGGEFLYSDDFFLEGGLLDLFKPNMLPMEIKGGPLEKNSSLSAKGDVRGGCLS